MNILVNILLSLLGIVALLAVLLGILFLRSRIGFRASSKRSLAQLGPEASIITVDGLEFRDLNKNGETAQGQALPLDGRPKVYVENMEREIVSQYADVVETPQQADVAILRLRTPWRPMGRGFLERIFHQGDLDFEDEEKARILQVLDTVPTIVDVYLDRGAVIPEIAGRCAALLADLAFRDFAGSRCWTPQLVGGAGVRAKNPNSSGL
ncbi:MAG: hypothetical protein V3S14_02880 [Anaerolineae bacterium]